MNDLPETADLGRLTRGAGYAILGRLALYNEKWDEAISAYREVMKLGYSLHPNTVNCSPRLDKHRPKLSSPCATKARA